VHLLGMLARAAEVCQGKGERLVLVVDGLDEDRGVTSGPDAYSIAALLPAEPPAGMRVVVAGRPNPPIPSDVPDGHPLRDPAIVRVLTASPHAAAVRQDAERELKHLLHGTDAELDLLGLLTAAGGGLSGADLADLTGLSLWRVNQDLSAVAGRTFTPRLARWRRESSVYVLAHEELQKQASKALGTRALDGYRRRLHTWADGYRQRGWPAETPEYLLRGYHRLLRDTGEVARMVACSTDQARHDRMFTVSGGDAAALSEIAIAQDLVLAQPDLDLPAMARLAAHRERLTERAGSIRVNLPLVWALLGQPERAEALARSIPDPNRQAWALAGVARAIAACGDITAAEAIASAITEPRWQPYAWTGMARTLARTGDLRRARGLAERAEAAISPKMDLSDRAWTMAGVVEALAAVGESGRAARLQS
jgi:hypothetical protein